MPHDEGLPQTGDAQEIGQDAVDCLRANRPKGWRLTDLGGDNDFGFDFQVQLSAEQQVLHPFRLQLKGTRSPKPNADFSHLSIPLSTSTLRYFDNTDEPVLLVLCDLSVEPREPRNCPLYYVWVRDELDRINIGSIPLEQKESLLHVPTANILNRTTDLLAEVRKRHRLSRIGHSLALSVAGMAPLMTTEDRVVMVESISKNIATRNKVFAQALAEPATDIWVKPPHGSAAWLLTEAKLSLASGKLDKCESLLQQAAEKLPDATALERAEYWYLIGKVLVIKDDDSAASEAFSTAVELEPQAKHWSAWAECELRKRYRLDGRTDYSEVLAKIPPTQDPTLLSARARLLAGSQRFKEAISLLDTFEGAENLATRAIVQTMRSNHEAVLLSCTEGLALHGKDLESKRLLFLILRARARFYIALRNARLFESSEDGSKEELLPSSGPLGVDSDALRTAWRDIEEAVTALEEIGWISNAEFVVDIWTATASMLGKQTQILDRVLAAARARSHQAELQSAAESIAVQCGDFKAALEANTRLPDSDIKALHRITFLHELGKHRDCVEAMANCLDRVNHQHQAFPAATESAILSADILARSDLVEEWRDLLQVNNPAHAATLTYLLARRKNRLDGNDAIAELTRQDTELGSPSLTTLLLLQELDVNVKPQAEQLLDVAARYRTTARLSPAIATKICAAFATLGRWKDLLSLCEEAEREFDPPRRIPAFRALALDQMGRTDEARMLIESMMEGGIDDGLALKTYVNIMVRWGIHDKAQSAVERILEGAQTRERKMECIHMLFKLEQHANPASSKLIDLAFRMGEIADQDDEVQEGVFIGMLIESTSFGVVTLSPSQALELQKRTSAFFTNFPQSKVVRRVQLPQEADAEEILRTLQSACGFSEEQEQARVQLESQLHDGSLPLPFAWRPRFALSNVQDVAHLWERAKRSSQEEKQFHLSMVGPHWSQRAASAFQAKTPLFDLLTLFVLKDLDMIHLVFEFFPQIAIGQGTLTELMRMVQVFSGSVLRNRCAEIQAALRPHLAQILQPQGGEFDDDEHLDPSSREIKALANTDTFILYSDDAMLRMWALGKERFASAGMCTLDLLSALEETGRLSKDQVAEKIAKLCEWNVGIHIQLRHHLAFIHDDVCKAPNVSAGVAILSATPQFMSITEAIWRPNADFESTEMYVSVACRELTQDPKISDVAIASFIKVWAQKMRQRPDMPLPELDLITHTIVLSIALAPLSVESTRTLWNVYFRLAEAVQGYLDNNAAGRAISSIARKAARVDSHVKDKDSSARSVIGERLMMGLDFGSDAWTLFSAAYVKSLQS